eukprot:COSAG01_NODE_59552_length_299_cov_2.330000_1_plen_67_part_10
MLMRSGQACGLRYVWAGMRLARLQPLQNAERLRCPHWLVVNSSSALRCWHRQQVTRSTRATLESGRD